MKNLRFLKSWRDGVEHWLGHQRLGMIPEFFNFFLRNSKDFSNNYIQRNFWKFSRIPDSAWFLGTKISPFQKILAEIQIFESIFFFSFIDCSEIWVKISPKKFDFGPEGSFVQCVHLSIIQEFLNLVSHLFYFSLFCVFFSLIQVMFVSRLKTV